MNDFLRSAEEQLKLNKDKTAVMSELSDHYETKKEFFESIGYDESASAEKANEAMGDGEVVGQRLDQIHKRKGNVWFPILGIIAVNLFVFSDSPTESSSFFMPFITSLIILIFDLLGTAVAIRYKNIGLSVTVIIFSFFPLSEGNFSLAYPLCNLIVSNVFGNAEVIVYYLSRVITALIGALIVIPNIFNIYHCKKIKKLINTRKQNIISRAFRNGCVIATIFCLVASFPYYAMNERVCNKQATIRNELMGFILDTANQFDYNEWNELAEYLENCEYDFEYRSYNYGDMFGGETYTGETYRYSKGNWSISFEHNDEDPNGYSVGTTYDADFIYNLSLKYFYVPEEKINALIKKIGDSTVGPGNAMGHSAEEISDALKGFDLKDMGIDKREDGTVYKYSWMPLKSYFGCYHGYEFQFDNECICYYYELY